MINWKKELQFFPNCLLRLPWRDFEPVAEWLERFLPTAS